jgi:predicted PurR-regulated permease PerM
MLMHITNLLISIGVIVFLTFFFLTFGERLHQKIARLGRTFAELRRLVAIARDIQPEIRRSSFRTFRRCGRSLSCFVAETG